MISGRSAMGDRKKYTEQYKKDAVRLLKNRGARSAVEIAESVGVSQSMLYRWHQQYAGETGSSAAEEQEDREGVEKLRRRLRELEQENALLKKAAALFAKEVK
jgi:transposase